MEGSPGGTTAPAAAPAPMHGRVWWLFFLLWGAALGFGLEGAWRYAAELRVALGAEQLYGFQVRDLDAGIAAGGGAVVQFPLGREAMAAGVRAGERLIAIDGRRVRNGNVAVREQLAALGEASAIDATFASEGRIHTVRLTRSRAHAEQGFGASGISLEERLVCRAAIFLLSFFLIPVGLALLLLLRRRRDPLAPWASLAMVVNALGSGPALYALSGSGDGALGIAVAIACPLAGWAQIAVLALFPDRDWRSPPTLAVLLGSLPLMYWLRVESSVLETNVALLAGQFAAIAVVWRRYRLLPQGTGRQQIRWALFGFGASLVAQALTIVAQRVFFNTPDPAIYVWLNLLADVLAGLAIVLLFGALTLGLMRYRLYDADATISLSVAYGALTVALLAVFAGSEKVIEVLGEKYFGGSLGAFANGLGAAVAAAMIGPLHHRVTRWAERRFRTGLVQLRHGLPLLVGDMRETASPQRLADAMLTRVEKGVRARHGAVTLGPDVIDTRDVDPSAVEEWLGRLPLPSGGGHKLHCDRADPLFPMRVPLQADAIGHVGWLLLGPRPDGSFYGREERDALLEVADPIARALAIASDRQARETERRREIERIEGELKALGRFVEERLSFGGGAGTLSGALA